MAISISHQFVSAIPDARAEVAAGELVPSTWNAAHALSGATAGSVLFVGAGSVLAQDNANFFWDDTNFNLKIGGAYHINTKIAVYVVPNGSGDNWFEGDAGNTSVTGYSNFGTGPNALSALTSGVQNSAIGVDALRLCTT